MSSRVFALLVVVALSLFCIDQVAAQRSPGAGTSRRVAQVKRTRSAPKRQNTAITSAPLASTAPFARVSVRFTADPQACGKLGCEIEFVGITRSGQTRDISQADIFKNGFLGSRAEVLGEADAVGMPRLVVEQGNIDAPNTRNLFMYDAELGRYAFVGGLPDTADWRGLLTVRSADLIPTDPTRARLPKAVPLQTAALDLCSSASKNDTCEFVLLPVSTMADPCGHRDRTVIYACWDLPIRLAEALGKTDTYVIMFDDGEPALDRAVIPVDRFYRTAQLRRDKRGSWKRVGQFPLGGLIRCPDYGLSSLQQRQIEVAATSVRVVRYQRCNLANDGRYTHQDRRLAEPAPFIRPGMTARALMDAGAPVTRTAAPQPTIVWALGRARYLVERGGQCGAEQSLGQPYCFGEAIDWLNRHPDKREIDVIAMHRSWLPGSLVPHGGGQGWDIIRVRRTPDGFRADRQLHYAVKITLPPRCMNAGAGDKAWYISLVGGRKAAVEAGQYACAGWAGEPIYAGAADVSGLDADRLDWTGTAAAYRDRNQGPQRARATSGFYDLPAGMVAEMQERARTTYEIGRAADRAAGISDRPAPASDCVANEALQGLRYLNGGGMVPICPAARPAKPRPRR